VILALYFPIFWRAATVELAEISFARAKGDLPAEVVFPERD